MQADYGIDDSNEVFTIDDLGNRDNVNLRTGSDEDYVIDANTNRYESIDSNALEYDAAGNMTEDKDGCQYEYDYENRLVRVRDANDVNVAEFAYDALSRRIEKKDLVDANNTRRYYYNYKWQVLCEYDDANDLRNYYIYGNYIDEALIVQDAEVYNWNYYVHDHLYSTVALLEWNGTVVERYEYDAYGRCTILDPNYAIDADQKSDYSNPYLFTGRRLDTLDDGDLEIMYYRNRYLNSPMGRFLTHDPLGITPNPQRPNKWGIKDQYRDGVNFYEYALNNPVIESDSYGLYPTDPSQFPQRWGDYGGRDNDRETGSSPGFVDKIINAISVGGGGEVGIIIATIPPWGAIKAGVHANGSAKRCCHRTGEKAPAIGNMFEGALGLWAAIEAGVSTKPWNSKGLDASGEGGISYAPLRKRLPTCETDLDGSVSLNAYAILTWRSVGGHGDFAIGSCTFKDGCHWDFDKSELTFGYTGTGTQAVVGLKVKGEGQGTVTLW